MNIYKVDEEDKEEKEEEGRRWRKIEKNQVLVVHDFIQ